MALALRRRFAARAAAFHVHGLVAGLTASLAAGGRSFCASVSNARDVLDRLAVGDVTMFFGVPTMYVRLLERAGDRPRSRPSSLRFGLGGPVSRNASQIRRPFRRAILERYGATEFGFALGNRYGGPRVAGSVGVPFPGVRVRVAGNDGAAAPPGGIGELLVSGPNVFSGYWRDPEATSQAFFVDAGGTRWYRSGDLARYDARCGVYRIVGRLKELIITGGFNVYPREVEETLEAFAEVAACAVVGKPDPARGEVPVAFVEVDRAVDGAALLAAVRERLASFKVPKEIHVLESLPRNAMGKIDKPALRRLLN